MFEYSIVFNNKLPEVLLNSVKVNLSQGGFVYSLITIENDNVLLIKMQDVNKSYTLKKDQIIYNMYEQLQFQLPKIQQSMIQKSRELKLFYSIREHLDIRIKQCEQQSTFKANKSQNYNLEGFEYLRELAIYQILSLIPVSDELKKYLQEQNKQVDGNMFIVLRHLGFLKDLCPIRGFRHNYTNELKLMFSQGFGVLGFIAHQIKQQLGEQTGFYFAYLLFFIKRILIVALLGAITYFLDKIYSYNVIDSPVESIYAILIVFWGAYFVGEWFQKQKEYAVLWGSSGQNYENFSRKLDLSLYNSLSHHDEVIIQKSLKKDGMVQHLDLVTGELIWVYKDGYKVIIRGVLSAFPYLIALFIFLIASLNARGYINPDSLIHITYLQDLSKPGGTFDAATNYSLILTIIHVLVVYILNIKYRESCMETTILEGHGSFESFEKSLIIKRFIFESLSAFTDFFYIGFINADIVRLKSEMFSMFAVDEIRRLVSETLLPTITKNRLAKKIAKNLEKLSPWEIETIEGTLRLNQNERSSLRKILQTQLTSIYLPKLELFDDYLELILNFGYLCFFTSAFVLSGIFIAFFLIAEFFSDYYKTYHLYQKPIPFKSKSIGPWVGVMNIIIFISVYCNLLLFSVSSDKIVLFFPTLFQKEAPQRNYQLLMATPLPEHQTDFVLVIFLLEHILLIMVYLIYQYTSRRQSWVDIYLKRQEYKKHLLNK